MTRERHPYRGDDRLLFGASLPKVLNDLAISMTCSRHALVSTGYFGRLERCDVT